MRLDAKNSLLKSQLIASVNAVRGIADAIRELGAVPSGELYVRVMDVLTLEQYRSIIGILTRAGMIECRGHLLTWIVQTDESAQMAGSAGAEAAPAAVS